MKYLYLLILQIALLHADDHSDQQKIDYYNNQNGVIGDHAGSTIADWTDADYTSELPAEKAAAFGTNFYVPAGRDSDHTIQVCIDSWPSEGSWRLWDSISGSGTGGEYISALQYFSAAGECNSLTLSLEPGWYSVDSWDSYGDGGQDIYADGNYVGSSSGSFSETFFELEDLPVPGCTYSSACNYDPNATNNDGSCEYAQGSCNCNGDPTGNYCNCNYNVNVGCGCGVAAPSGCNNVCGSTLENDDCGVCGGGNADDLGCGCFEAGPSGCDNQCGSTLENDECGVCGGDGSDDQGCGCFEAGTSGCDNTCGSDLVDDACGVCGGDGSDDVGCGCFEPGPSGCDNTCESTAELDDCGVCGGSCGNSCDSHDDCFGENSVGPNWCYSNGDGDAYCVQSDWDFCVNNYCYEGDGDCDCGGDCSVPGAEQEECVGNLECVQYDGMESGLVEGTDICECTVGYDCAGECGGNAVVDCANECNGTAVDDCAGVCGGDSVLSGCDNACNSTAVEDCAGVCDGDSVLSGCDNACNSTAVEDCAGVCDGISVVDDCGTCDDDSSNDCIDYCLDLHEGANLISFYALPDDVSITHVMSSIEGNATGVIGEGVAANYNGTDWLGSLNTISSLSGYWVIVSEAGSLCIEDGTPTDPAIQYSLESGANLISFPIEGSVEVSSSLPDDIEGFVSGIIGEGVAANNQPPWQGSLSNLSGGNGYWMITTEDISFSFDVSTMSRIKFDDEVGLTAPDNKEIHQSTQQAFYFIESIENIEIGDWILAYNGDNVIGARQWQGSIIDVPAMGNDGSDYTKGYIEAGEVPSFKILRGDELINLEGDIPSWENNQLYMVSSLTEAVALPETFSLDRAYPNPFNPTTTLSFSIPIDSEVSLSIYNLQGREVSTLIDANMDAGYHSVVWDANSYASGVYFVKMVAGEFVNTQKLMLIK